MTVGRASAALRVAAVGITLAACAAPAPPPGPTPTPTTPTPGPTADPPTVPTRIDALAQLVPGRVAKDGVLAIGTDPSYPPMEFVDDTGTVAGVDIDLAGAVATVLGLTPEFEDEAFSALGNSVRSGRIELAASSLTIEPNARLTSNAVLYFRSGNQLVAARETRRWRPGFLCGREIATLEGSVQVRTLSRRSRECRDAGRPGILIDAYSDQDQVTRATVEGRVDGMLSDVPIAQYAISRHPRQLRASGRPFDPAPFGMLTAAKQRTFTRAVERAVQSLINSGFYDWVLDRWGVAAGAVDKATIRWNDRLTNGRTGN